MQEHLCQTLAHYLAYLAPKLGLSIPKSTERRLVEAAHTRWNKEGQFSWSFNLLENDNYNDCDHPEPLLNSTDRQDDAFAKSPSVDLNTDFLTSDWMQLWEAGTLALVYNSCASGPLGDIFKQELELEHSLQRQDNLLV